MMQVCTNPWCQQSFEVTDGDLAFYEKVSPIFDDKKHRIPPPIFCPDCRMQQRMTFRNDRHFYHRQSDLSGKDLVAIYSPEKPYTVYDKDEWWSDSWDPRDYGREIDFSRPFFPQFQELRLSTPRACLFTSNTENSYYTNHALNMKNCYLIWGGGEDEGCLYGNYIAFCKDIMDGFSLYSCERCYDGIASERCYNCIGFLNCRDCTDCWMIEECTACKHCIGCYGLYRREYCLFNQQYTKEEWERRLNELGSLTREKMRLLREHLENLKTGKPRRGSHIYACENCTGDSIFNSKNCHHCFDIKDCEDCKYVAFTPKGISTYDATFSAPEGLEKSYFVQSTLGGQGLLFDFLCYYCGFTLYSQECHYCNFCFGCSSMRHNEYCILNKQYSKDEYEKMASKLVSHMQETGEWGHHFPSTMAPIAYNESNANDFFPLAKKEVLSRGWSWRDEDPVQEQGELLMDIPETIENVDDAIIEKVLTCEETGKQFKIMPQELHLYRTLKLPIPRKHPVARHKERLARRCPRRLWQRPCNQCGKEIPATYSPKHPEQVFCEECYLKEVY
jgi:hypothetical protein